jgi:hypothetical protein
MVLAALGAEALVEQLRHVLPQRAFLATSYALVVVVLAEAANVYLRQTLFTDALKYARVATPEMTFLSALGARARVIDEYEDEHKHWIGNLPLSRRALPRWIMPAYAGTPTFSRVGVSYVQDDFLAFYNRALDGAYFGIKPGGAWSPLLDVAAVTHLVSRQPVGGAMKVELRGPDYTISANTSALPRVQIYSTTDVLPDDAGLAQLARVRPGTPFGAIVAPEYGAQVKALDARASGKADIGQIRDEFVEIEASVTGRSLVVLADTFHPSWRAWVDGAPAPIVRANVAFRGVVIEAGEHKIEFRFEPDYHRALVTIAGLSLVLHLIAAVVAFRRRALTPLANSSMP